MFNKYKKGISLVEVIIASSIISIFMMTVSSVYSNFVQLSYDNVNKTQSVFLLDEGVDAVKTIAANSWVQIGSLLSGTDYYLVWQDNRWQSTTTLNTIDNIFIRKFNVQDVYRDPTTLNIVYTGGVSDINSKIINMQVLWNYKGSTTTKEISFYIFNIYE